MMKYKIFATESAEFTENEENELRTVVLFVLCYLCGEQYNSLLPVSQCRVWELSK